MLLIGVSCIIRKCLLTEYSYVGKKYEWFLGFVLSLIMVTGVYFDNELPYEFMGKDIVGYTICIFSLTPLFKCIFTALYSLLARISEREKKKEKISQSGAGMRFFIFFSVIIGCWILVWLAYYPGLWNYDPWQVNQFINQEFNEFHPLVHTLLLGFCYKLGLGIGNANYGVIVYDFV